jgi:hypothetical protein
VGIILLIATAFVLFLFGSFVVVFRRLSAHEPLAQDDAWTLQTCADRYRPLERLLDVQEYRFLESHRGFRRSTIRRYRRRRVQVFRGYLRCLSVDYGRICAAIRLLIVQSPLDRPDLASLLVRQRLVFAFHFLLAEYRLSLHGLGLGHVDVAHLLNALEQMQVQLRDLTVEIFPAAA